MEGRRGMSDSERKGDAVVRVVCDAECHPDRKPVIATYRRLPSSPSEPVWYWDSALAVGGGPITWNAEREWRYRRPGGALGAEVPPKRPVQAPGNVSWDRWKCPHCRFEHVVNHMKLRRWLEVLHQINESTLSGPGYAEAATSR